MALSGRRLEVPPHSPCSSSRGLCAERRCLGSGVREEGSLWEDEANLSRTRGKNGEETIPSRSPWGWWTGLRGCLGGKRGFKNAVCSSEKVCSGSKTKRRVKPKMAFPLSHPHSAGSCRILVLRLKSLRVYFCILKPFEFQKGPLASGGEKKCSGLNSAPLLLKQVTCVQSY